MDPGHRGPRDLERHSCSEDLGAPSRQLGGRPTTSEAVNLPDRTRGGETSIGFAAATCQALSRHTRASVGLPWHRRGLCTSRTRLGLPICRSCLATLCLGLGPILGGRVAQIGRKMGTWGRVRLLQRPWRCQVVADDPGSPAKLTVLRSAPA